MASRAAISVTAGLDLRRAFATEGQGDRDGGDQLLAGVRVVDLSRVLAAPYATQILGDMGAEVIKIEAPDEGDMTRAWGPPFHRSGPDPSDREADYFFCANRNKKSITVNLKSTEGVQVVKDLVACSDILVENFVPGMLDRFGLGYDDCAALNDRIIYASLSGYGGSGPMREVPGFDVIASAVGGLMGITGEADGGPVKVGVAITDITTGLFLHGAVLAALYKRSQTGRGERIETSLLEAQVAALVNIGQNYLSAGTEGTRWGTAHASIVPYQAFAAEDGYVILGGATDSLFRKLCKALDLEDVAADPRFATNLLRVEHRDECVGAIQERVGGMAVAAVVAAVEPEGVPCGPINSMEQVFSHPQVHARDMVAEVDHPTAGRIKLIGAPVKFANHPTSLRTPPPLLGEHTDSVLSDLLGYSPERIAKLRDSGAI